MKGWFQKQFDAAMKLNRQNILDMCPHRVDTLLDLGCDDGEWSVQVANAAQAKTVQGVEIVPERASAAEERGIYVTRADLAANLPLPSAEFDLVHANQVIEHVADIDLFAAEIFRVLRPGGTVIISTENGSSWHNLFAMALGWQMFSLTNLSERRLGIGNPLALHRGESDHMKTWTHKVIFSYRGLREFFEAHGFYVQGIRGAGYYPLPAGLGRLDVRHAHFLTLVASRPC
jgi:ubiquinone/menaquinone biosynthesis C-methylase UbiE